MSEFIALINGKRYELGSDQIDMDVYEVATVLSRIPRFGGHAVPMFAHWSVCHHAVLCAEVARDDGGTGTCIVDALTHDNAEVIVGDITSPVKRAIGGDYRSVERAAHGALRTALRLTWSAAYYTSYVADIDMAALRVESTIVGGCEGWGLTELVPQRLIRMAGEHFAKMRHLSPSAAVQRYADIFYAEMDNL